MHNDLLLIHQVDNNIYGLSIVYICQRVIKWIIKARYTANIENTTFTARDFFLKTEHLKYVTHIVQWKKTDVNCKKKYPYLSSADHFAIKFYTLVA